MIKSFFSTFVLCFAFLNCGLIGDCSADFNLSPVSQSVSEPLNSSESDYDPPEAIIQSSLQVNALVHISNLQVYKPIGLFPVPHGSFQPRAPPFSA
ncbi:MAG: hypothetical protein OQK03_12005 [Colwellia sp.]|nr:hypothetical protein [Colwellia sp.]